MGSLCKDDNKFYFFGGSDINTRTCGLVKYTLDTNQVNKESDNLAFGFTTTVADALLIRIESENGGQYLEIKLRGGFVALELTINGVLEKREYMPISNKQFNDNRYYDRCAKCSDILKEIDGAKNFSNEILSYLNDKKNTDMS